MTKCKVDGCEKESKTVGLCSGHGHRLRRYGDPEYVPPPRTVSKCSIDGCEGDVRGKGYCRKHYARLRAHGDFMQTYTGRKFWPMDPRADEIDIRDIAHSLALQCRYAGHCKRFYSVAEHSVLMARWLRGKHGADIAMWGLLHDASETYLVDVPRPVKPYLTGYKDAENMVMRRVCDRFGLPHEMPKSVHEADNRILADELVNLVPMDWHNLHKDPLGVPMMYWQPAEAEEEFLATYAALSRQVGGV